MSAAVYDVPRTKSFQSVAGKYDEEKHGWKVDFTAPTDSFMSYEIEIHLSVAKMTVSVPKFTGYQLRQPSKSRLQFYDI